MPLALRRNILSLRKAGRRFSPAFLFQLTSRAHPVLRPSFDFSERQVQKGNDHNAQPSRRVGSKKEFTDKHRKTHCACAVGIPHLQRPRATAAKRFSDEPHTERRGARIVNPLDGLTMAATHVLVPRHLSGNITDQQNKLLQDCLGEAVQIAYREAIEQVDRQSAQAVLEENGKLKAEVSAAVFEIIHRYAVSHKFEDEEVASDRTYPPTYRLRPVEAQVTELRKTFPILGNCQEKLGRVPLPDEPEGWFVIPRWQALAPTYNEAVEMMLGVLASRRRFSNRIAGRLGKEYLRQTERSRLGETILAEQQPGNDILVLGAQVGMLHRGCSARRTRMALAGNEFCLGVFAIGCMLLTHLSACRTANPS